MILSNKQTNSIWIYHNYFIMFVVQVKLAERGLCGEGAMWCCSWSSMLPVGRGRAMGMDVGFVLAVLGLS